MKMFITPEEHSQYHFERVADKPKTVIISTFGIYCGITYSGQDTTQWGDKYRLATRDLMEAMRGIPDVRMLIGVANYKSCRNKQQCLDCEKQYVQQLVRLVFHAELFPEFQWRVTTELHLKCSIFLYPDKPKKINGIAGGRNFTDSKWADITFELSETQIKTVYNHVKEQWNKAVEITDDAVAEIFRQQNISANGFQSVVGSLTEDES
jgi:hypothetical protein